MNNKPKKYSARLDFRCTPELKHAFTTAQAINKDKFTEFLIKACNKFISKYSSVHDAVHDETDKSITPYMMNDGVVHDELNDDVRRDETDKFMTYDAMNDDAVHDEINLSESEINDLLIYSEVDPDYKAKAKEFNRLRMEKHANNLYEEVFGQPTSEVGGMEALFND